MRIVFWPNLLQYVSKQTYAVIAQKLFHDAAKCPSQMFMSVLQSLQMHTRLSNVVGAKQHMSLSHRMRPDEQGIVVHSKIMDTHIRMKAALVLLA